MKLFLSTSHNPFHNVAIERVLFLRHEECVYLWVNAPCVVIGRNQNPYQEASLPFLKKEGIALVRRYSGGGAVYQDLGNLNYTYISNENNPAFVVGLIAKALRKFSISVEESGRNDLLAEGRKISGIASLTDDGYYLYHGTLLIDVNLNRLVSSLHPSKLKLASKGISSVSMRVKNLKELSPTISVQGVINEVQSLLALPLLSPPKGNEVEKEEAKLKSHEWVFLESPEYQIQIEERLHQSLYRFSFLVVSGAIQDAKVNTDDLNPINLSSFCHSLVGQEFSPEKIKKLIKKQNDKKVSQFKNLCKSV